MYEHELLVVKDHFLIENVGLVVVPDFPVEEWRDMKGMESVAKVVIPDGGQSVHKVHIGTVHFQIKDQAASLEKSWRNVVSFPDSTKLEIPIGSKVFVSSKVYEIFAGKKSTGLLCEKNRRTI